MKLYGLKNCDTCRRALKALKADGHDVELIDVRNAPIEPAEIERFFVIFGPDLLNRRSTTWRQLSEAQREAKPVQLLLDHPTLMKRPVIIEEGGLPSLGWGKDVQKLWGIKD